MWLDAIAQASRETGIDEGAFPEANPWEPAETLTRIFGPTPDATIAAEARGPPAFVGRMRRVTEKALG
jgi:hypothetical protein